MNYLEKAKVWKDFKGLDPALKKELDGMTDQDLQEAFTNDLEFGTGGLRGILGCGTNRMNIYIVEKATLGFGRYLLKQSKVAQSRGVAISHDNRHFSVEFARKSAEVLTSLGFRVFLFEALRPTPELSYAVRNFNCIGGIMITASHNPYHDNGIKIIDSNGDKMKDDFLKEVEDYIDGAFYLEASSDTGKCYDYIFGRNEYVKHLIDIPKESFRGYKIGLDCANGASFSIASNIFNLLGADVFAINNHPDGENINVKCGSTRPEILQKYVVKNNLDVGFAFDGDADRCMMVDEQGKLVDGDGIIYIISKYLKLNSKLNKDTVVATACPKHIVAIQHEKRNKEGVFTACCTDESACIGCAMCAMMCPDCAIIIEK